MNKLFSPFLFVFLALLSACNGSSEDTSTPENATPVVSSITMTLQTSDGVIKNSFNKSEDIYIAVTVKDQFNNLMIGSRVDFSADLGNLSASSKLTDTNGIANIKINNNELILSAGTLTASISSLSTTADYEFINTSSNGIELKVLVEMILNGQIINQIKANEQAQIQVTLRDNDDAPISNEIINFAADIGVLNTKTALTNQNGQASVTLSGDETIGAGVIGISLASDNSVSTQMNYQVLAADSVVIDDVRLGHFNGDTFVAGEIKLSIENNTISAGGTLGLSVDVVDAENNPINTPTTVSFTSNCVINNNANIDASVFSIKGKAGATFEDINCAGITGTEDVIVASVTANGITNTASATVNISSEKLGSIEFVSSQPNSIVIKGSGGQETSTLTFLLKSDLSNPLAQQEVEFSLDSNVGGVTLSRSSGFTNSQGLITTQVSAGTVPTVVRVTAKSSMTVNNENVTVQTQSRELSVNTGLPEQASMTISATILNPEASKVGEQSEIRVWLADSFNNPVPDGTTVNFTTEGGSIESSCNTLSGNCAVTWTATEPYLADHRSTILATTSGHETFFDANGNNVFDDSDGNAISNIAVNSGFGRQTALSAGFVDMSEAWRDDNENNVKDGNETKFFDNNGNGTFDSADGKFNGPQCTGSKCDENVKKAILRKALVLIMSTATPNYILSNSDQTITYANNAGSNTALPNIADGTALNLRFRFADSALQTMPLGTIVTIELEGGGELQGTTSVEIGNTAKAGYRTMNFAINNPVEGDPEQATLSIIIDTPNTLPVSHVIKSVSLL